MDYIPQTGDVFLVDSSKIGPKIVKFLQTAPTLWQYIWRAIRGTQQTVRYFHAGMVLNSTQVIEQQWKVQYGQVSKFLGKRVIVYRFKHITPSIQNALSIAALEDLGKAYDIPLVIGRTITWLTGIMWFTDFLGRITKEEEWCVTRLAEWWWPWCKFGIGDHSEITTKVIDEYYSKHSDEWEVVYQNG